MPELTLEQGGGGCGVLGRYQVPRSFNYVCTENPREIAPLNLRL